MNKSFSFYKFNAYFVAFVLTVSSFVPSTYAAVIDDYSLRIKSGIVSRIQQDSERTAALSRFDTLVACLNRPWEGHAGKQNWQYSLSGTDVSTDEGITRALENEANHPCHDASRAVPPSGSAQLFPEVIVESRDRTILDQNATLGFYFERSAAARTAFENYYSCLMTADAGVPRWTTGGSSQPASAQELQTRVIVATHPCHALRETLGQQIEAGPVTAQQPAPAPQPNAQANTPSQNSNTNSAPAAGNIDTRPIYDRIAVPASTDLLTPSFATSNPSLTSLVNFLFDLFVRRLLPWLVALMVLLIVWAGYNYILANGDSAKIKQAKDMILYSLIAMVLAISALSIITVLNNVLTAAT